MTILESRSTSNINIGLLDGEWRQILENTTSGNTNIGLTRGKPVIVGDLPEILRLIEGVPCINAENSGVAGGGIRTLQLAIRQLPEYVSKWGLVL